MKKEYDFSKGERGKFYRPDAEISLPIYLEPDVREYFHDAESVNKALRRKTDSSPNKSIRSTAESSG
jgi:hypothetical protein